MKRDLLKITILACLITLLFSCATRQKYIDQQKAWIGKSIDGYMQEFGMPQNVIQVSPNPNIVIYVYIRKAINPNTPAYAGNPMNSLIMANRNPNFVQFGALMCTTWVSIDKNTKIIKNITFRGNYCATSN
ncbi:hypothetical protein FM755_07130 [Francisella tularensis]|uniref:Lipoprotein n=2 Tax=Francisella tularensis subsp. holarctica TaxID=119857 RepID=A0A0B3VXK5_FRATU|nr:hypothetical protein [Francisella tularensis]AFX70438.1 hypothetical protein F92_04050 [Francisella tularensis subsp. holarctica F92]AHH46225.1 hypothetical protein X557_03965 [Francisella tularensis subsp. holarctica PHIT-FT049]EBA52360.1 hypothetical lipoprotein [Francisella tularensis subsp. holarctica 257]ABI82685.1 conserved hypothetical protein [Francisella tularensis subsp. holarctica OSU18]ABU61255.1 hypothetical lipoprotein [Francisella tularensis subsp. holarctica FTNF002-00]